MCDSVESKKPKGGERNPDLVDRMEPTVRDHSMKMVNREATVVHADGVVLLEGSRRGC